MPMLQQRPITCLRLRREPAKRTLDSRPGPQSRRLRLPLQCSERARAGFLAGVLRWSSGAEAAAGRNRCHSGFS